MNCGFTYDDGAYILGSLAPAERAAYERHLPTCAACRESVAQLAVLPGLLGRLDPATAAPSVTAPLTLLPRVLRSAATHRRAEQRQRTRVRAVLGVAAALLAVAVGLSVHVLDRPGTSPVIGQPGPSSSLSGSAAVGPGGTVNLPAGMTAMSPVLATLPIDASIGLTPARDGIGTWVGMRCYYSDGGEGAWAVRLVVFPRDGEEAEQIGTWLATSGKEVKLSALTHLAADQIARVELQNLTHRTLLWWTPA